MLATSPSSSYFTNLSLTSQWAQWEHLRRAQASRFRLGARLETPWVLRPSCFCQLGRGERDPAAGLARQLCPQSNARHLFRHLRHGRYSTFTCTYQLALNVRRGKLQMEALLNKQYLLALNRLHGAAIPFSKQARRMPEATWKPYIASHGVQAESRVCLPEISALRSLKERRGFTQHNLNLPRYCLTTYSLACTYYFHSFYMVAPTASQFPHQQDYKNSPCIG